MRLCVMAMGRPKQSFIAEGVQYYQKRLEPLLPMEWLLLNEPGKGKKLDAVQRTALEGQEFLSKIDSADRLVLLDERGRQWSSSEMSEHIYAELLKGQRGRLVFLIGGPYGTSPELQQRADALLSLSRMTFTHEMALLLLTEQIYRAAMIHSGSQYHH